MSEYELTLVTTANASPEDLEKFVEEIKKIITDGKGEVVSVESWGKRPLAYEVKKQKSGNYTHIVFKGEQSVLKALNKNLRVNDQVLRYLNLKRENLTKREETSST